MKTSLPQSPGASRPAMAGDRMLSGTLIDKAANFRFEVWAYRRLTEQELAMSYQMWLRQRDRRRSLKNKTIQVIANFGMTGGF